MNSACYIYEVVNNTNGKKYVGSTINPPNARWREHKWKLNKGTHHSYKLQKAWNKYGQDTFSFKTILICKKDDMVFYERELIKTANYNVAKDPLRNGIETRWANHIKKAKPLPYTKERRSADRTKEWSDPIKRQNRILSLRKAFSIPEVREKLRATRLGYKQTKEAIVKSATAKWKPVYCKELEVSFLNQKYAAEYLGFARSTITEALKRKGKVANKYTLVRVV
jgi:group I intron endonuclease